MVLKEDNVYDKAHLKQTESSCRDQWWNGNLRKLWNVLAFAALPNSFPRKRGETLPYVLSLHQQWVGTPFLTVSPHRWRSPSECWHNEGLCPSDSHWSLQKMGETVSCAALHYQANRTFYSHSGWRKLKRVATSLLHLWRLCCVENKV